MKRSHLTHTAWGLATLSAFALGFTWNHFRPASLPSPLSPRLLGSSSSAAAPSTNRKPPNLAPSPGAPLPLNASQREALAKLALTDPNPLRRHQAFAQLLDSLTPENAPALLESLQANRASPDQWRLFLYAWGSKDGPAAIAHANTLPDGRKDRFLDAALPGWAGQNPTAATAWLESLEEGDSKNRQRANLVAGLADHDIALATSYALNRATLGDKQAETYLRTIAEEELRKNGPAAATAWGEALPDGPLKGSTLDRLAGAYAAENPAAAAAWAAQFANASYGPRVIEQIGSQWAQRDPQAAVAWLGTLDEGSARSDGTFSALRGWTRRDALGASQYLAALPPSPSKDSAVSGFARSLAREDPESAMIWAKTIGDETSRLKTLTRAGQTWFLRDPAQATQWLQSANLPESAQQAILNPSREDRRRARN